MKNELLLALAAVVRQFDFVRSVISLRRIWYNKRQ